MSLTVELETTTRAEQGAGGEVEKYTALTAVQFSGESGQREIEPHGSTAVLQAPNGARFDVNASYRFGDPEIWVETTMEDVDEFDYVSEKFTSVGQFEAWLAENDISLVASPEAESQSGKIV